MDNSHSSSIAPHTSALRQLLSHRSPLILSDFDLNQNAAHIIESVVEVAENAAQCHEHRLAIRAHLPDFARFVNHIMMRYRPTIGAVFVCGVYLGRAKKTLEILQWSKSACECILLGAVILASKYVNDRSYNNAAWASCSSHFTLADINTIERQFLDVLNYELNFTAEDIVTHNDKLIGLSKRIGKIHSNLNASNIIDREVYSLLSKGEKHTRASSVKNSPNSSKGTVSEKLIQIVNGAAGIWKEMKTKGERNAV